MEVLRLAVAFLTTGVYLLSGQTNSEPISVGPGVTPPKVLHKVEAEYSGEARSARVQGVVVFQLNIDERGRPVDITLISPLGFGLDERAEEALGKWDFKPGSKDGKPVKIRATVEVTFRMLDQFFDERAERQRTAFNVALHSLGSGVEAKEAKAVKTLQELAEKKFAPAMGEYGAMLLHGNHVPKDAEAGLRLISKAADKHYGPAIYGIGIAHTTGEGAPKDLEKGLGMLRDASVLGSVQAQYNLGTRYNTGDGVAADPDRAKRYFRLCSAAGVRECQYMLAGLIREKDPALSFAWLLLASEAGLPEARVLVAREAAKLTPPQAEWAERLKPQLLRRK